MQVVSKGLTSVSLKQNFLHKRFFVNVNNSATTMARFIIIVLLKAIGCFHKNAPS